MTSDSVPDVGGGRKTSELRVRGGVSAADVTVSILDTPVTIRTSSALAAAYLRGLWSRCIVEDPPVPPLDALIFPGTGPIPTREMLLRLTSELTMLGIERAAGSALMFHAAGVALKDGRMIALVGESGAGKSTATRALCRTDRPAPMGYVTDETVAVDADLRVRPFPKPLALIDDAQVKVHRGPDDMGLAQAPAHLTLAGIVLLRREAGHEGAPRVERVTHLDLIESLVPHTSALTRLADPVRRLSDLVSRCQGYTVHYREAADLAEVLAGVRWVARGPSDRGLGNGNGRSATVTPDDGWGRSTPARVTNDDVLITPDGAFLLAEGRPVRLGPVGVAVCEGLQAGYRGPQLVEQVTARYGLHPDAQSLIERACAQLAALALPGLDDAQ